MGLLFSSERGKKQREAGGNSGEMFPNSAPVQVYTERPMSEIPCLFSIRFAALDFKKWSVNALPYFMPSDLSFFFTQDPICAQKGSRM